MSFSRPYLLDVVPMSTRIKEDFLMSFQTLSEIKSDLKKYDNNSSSLIRTANDAINVVKVYNENTKYMNKEVENYGTRNFPDFKTYLKSHYYTSETNAKDGYENEKVKFEYKESQRMNELDLLMQVGDLSPLLRKKISSVFSKLRECESIAKQIPPFELEIPTRQFLFQPRLRSLLDTSINPYQTIGTFEPTQTTITSPIATQTIETTLTLPTTIDINVVCPLASDETFGVCCDPEWDKAPIAFTKNENGWSGSVPIGKDWKCVILKDGKAVQWENSGNRHCNTETKAFTLNVSF